MDLSYTLIEEDYLQQQLYYFSTNPDAKKMRKKAWLAAIIAFIVIDILLYMYADTFTVYFFTAVALLCIVAFPFFHKHRLKQTYRKSVRDIYKNNFGKEIHLSFNENQLEITGSTGESKINYTALEKIVEIGSHYFLVFKTGMQLIIPKNEVNNTAVATELEKLAVQQKVPFSRELDWKW
ncbi:YcxB family protein [Pricia sp. S334]|uniref:YcxB family protein n=1 Tax=Pricia mediterranea TaxID=3076079 RepID=A0ABU3L974_9FLAO|nr:YcxB family protein [Pricia sp. S334]MDT7830118.1 YcxB family protein [Pricia sp. S334]